MPNLTQPPDNPDGPPPPVITQYFRRCAEFDEAVELEEARRALQPRAS